MTPAQFAATAQLAGIRSPMALMASRWVLVDDMAPSVAADTADISRQQLSNTLSRLRRVLALMAVAA